jgi:hypothetical protein
MMYFSGSMFTYIKRYGLSVLCISVCVTALLAFVFAPVKVLAQNADKDHRILIILDGSAAMKQTLMNSSRFEMAGDFITTLVDSLYKKNNEVAFGLRLFGQQYDENKNICNDSRREVNFSKDNLGQVSLRLKDLQPRGRGAVAFAVTEALKHDVVDTTLYNYSIVLVKTNAQNCDDDMCHAFKTSGNGLNLYRKFLISVPGSTSGGLDCFDRSFDINAAADIATIVEYIVKQYPRRQRIVAGNYGTGSRKRKDEDYVPPVKTVAVPKAVEQPLQVSVPADTTSAPPKISKVEIRKGSRITMEDPEKFGVLRLWNTDLVNTINVYKSLGGGNYKLIESMYPIGLQQALLKLEPGEYKLVYTISVGNNISRFFDIVEQKVTEISFR